MSAAEENLARGRYARRGDESLQVGPVELLQTTSRRRARSDSGRLEAVVFAVVLAAFAAPVLGAERDPVEKVLEARLRLVYRAQKEAASAAGEAVPTTGAGAPAGRVGRVTATLDRLLGRSPSDLRTLTAALAAPPRLSLLVRHAEDCRALEPAGFRFQAQVGAVCTGSLEPERLADLARSVGVQHVALSQTLRASVPSAAPRTIGSASPPTVGPSDTPAAPASFGPHVLSGAGAVVAFIDTGVDVFHQDFRKADGTTRIKYLLDLSDPGDIDGDGDLDGVGPFGGTLHSEAQINFGLAAGSIRQRDTTGHGTHGLSVAAGDDAAFPGIAAAADLLVVKATRDEGTLSFVSTDVINALVFVDQKAQELGLPYVVNLSLGTIVAPHDGRSLEEQAIDTIVGPGRPGKVAVLAAGNSSDHRSSRYRHMSGTAFTGLVNTHTLTVPAFTANPGSGNDRIFLDVWYEGRDKLKVTVTPPGGSPVSAAFGNYLDLETPLGNVFIANLGGPSLENGDIEALILIDDWAGTAPAPGNWTIAFEGEEIGDTGEYHAWLADESQVGSTQPYLSANADNRYLVGKPGSALNGITVGSFARHDPATRFRTLWTDVNGIPRTDTSAVPNDISDFSSTGKTRDGRVKPEVTAPGERVLGAVSRDAFPGVAPNSIYRFHPFPEATGLLTDVTPDHAFGLLQGTSFSAPVLAGLAARILATNPGLDAVQVRNVLINSAAQDGFTGAVPNDVWGHGKVDLTVGGATLPGNLRITTDSLPGGVLNEPYDQVLTASGGVLPYSWSLAGGSLPPGLSLDSPGHITGSPSGTGTFNFTARVTDTSLPVQVATRGLQIVVSATSQLQIVTRALPPALVGAAYEELLEARGGAQPYTWSVIGGSLPVGLSLQSDGRINGQPTMVGRYAFTVRVQDAASAVALASVRVRIAQTQADQWDPLGIDEPFINYLALDPRDPQHLISSVANLRIFESFDGGESWTLISANNGFGSRYYLRQLAISPIDSVPWAIAGEGESRSLLAYDRAPKAWVQFGPCPQVSVTGIAFDAGGGLHLLASYCPEGTNAFYYSSDQGRTWAFRGNAGSLGISYGSISVYNPDPRVVYVAGGSGASASGYLALRSDDGGRTWTDIKNNTNSVLIRVSQTNPLDVVKEGFITSCCATVERSTDGGQTWKSVSLPANSGQPLTLERDATYPANLFVGAQSGLYRSTDAGQTWQHPPISSRNPHLEAIALDPSDPTKLYLGAASGVYHSADGGNSWVSRNHGLVAAEGDAIAISPSAPSHVLLLTSTAAYTSLAGGDRWTRVASNTFGTNTRPAIAADPNLYFVGTAGGRLQRSVNRGVSWSLLYGCGFGIALVATDPFDSNTLFVFASGRTFVRSTDRGETCTALTPPFADVSYLSGLSMGRDVSGRIYASCWNRGGGVCESGVYRSNDKGDSWAPFGLPGQSVNGLEAAPSNSEYVYAFFGSTVFFRDPAVGTWQTATVSPLRAIYDLAIDSTNPLIAYAGVDHPGTSGATGGLYKTVDGGHNWLRLTGTLDSFDVLSVATHPSLSGTVYVATREGGAFRTTDGGSTWTVLGPYGTVANVTNTIAKMPCCELLFAGTEGYGVQSSSDGGRTFAPIVTGLGNLNVNALAFEPGPTTVLLAGTDAGIFRTAGSPVWEWAPTGLTAGTVTDIVTDSQGTARRIWATVPGQGVAYSADGGATFTIYSSGLASLDLTSLELETVGVARRIWATTRGGDGVVFSDDLGQTWKSAAGSGLTDRNVNDFTHESGVARRIWGTARRIWATTDTGVFYSDNDGLSWTELSLGLPSGVPVTSVSIDPNTNEAMVSLFSDREGGVYRGANLSGVWSAFNEGLDELKVNRLTNDSGRVIDATTKATRFYAATSGDGAYQADVQTQTASTPTITTSFLATGLLRTAYSQNLTASGGTPPYVWSLPEGFLPPGLSLNPTGVISGDPGQVGTFSFNVQVKDHEGRLDRKSFSIVVENPLAPKVTSFSPTSGKAGTSVTLTGARFTGATRVAFAGTSAAFSISSDSVIQTSVPAGAAPGPISVTTSEGTGRSASDFLVFAPQPLYTLTPCRVVDTRGAAGPLGGPAIVAGQDRTFGMRGACGVPDSAKAVSVNLTVTQPTDAGDLRVFPAGTELPFVSSINYSPGQTRANNAVVTLGTGGAITIHCDQAQGSVHLLIDVNGYFQ